MEIEKYQNDERIQEVANEATALEDWAKTLEVIDEKTDIAAKETLSVIFQKTKKLEDLRKFFVRPMQNQVKNINSFFKERSMPLIRAEEIIDEKIIAYRKEKQEIARKEQARLLRLAEKRQERLDVKAQEKGGVAAPPVPVAIVATPEKTTKTDQGSVTIRTDWDVRVVNESLVPREYLIVDMKKLRAVVRAGIRQIPGCLVFERETVMKRGRR